MKPFFKTGFSWFFGINTCVTWIWLHLQLGHGQVNICSEKMLVPLAAFIPIHTYHWFFCSWIDNFSKKLKKIFYTPSQTASFFAFYCSFDIIISSKIRIFSKILYGLYFLPICTENSCNARPRRGRPRYLDMTEWFWKGYAIPAKYLICIIFIAI